MAAMLPIARAEAAVAEAEAAQTLQVLAVTAVIARSPLVAGEEAAPATAIPPVLAETVAMVSWP